MWLLNFSAHNKLNVPIITQQQYEAIFGPYFLLCIRLDKEQHELMGANKSWLSSFRSFIGSSLKIRFKSKRELGENEKEKNVFSGFPNKWIDTKHFTHLTKNHLSSSLKTLKLQSSFSDEYTMERSALQERFWSWIWTTNNKSLIAKVKSGKNKLNS